jgi:Xaa-Pro aminopeptidase
MFAKEIYIERRRRLRSLLDKGVVLILGNPEAPMNYPANTYRYRQDSNFLYFFGISHPGFAGVIDLDEGKDIIFGNDVDLDDIIWMGPQPSVASQAAEVGISNSQAYSELSAYLGKASLQGRKVHFLPPYRSANMMHLESLLGIPARECRKNASEELIKAVVSLRSVKEEAEIDHLDAIQDVAYEMHTTAMRLASPGIFEREIAGRIEGIALSNGGTVSFPVILSKRGETLHNHYHGNLLKAGDLLLVDAGFESEWCYATDHTRTVPVGGRFSPMQRDIYQIVLDANNNSSAAIMPGVRYKEAHLIAARTVAQGLKDLGLMKGNVDDAVANGAHAMFFPHGLGHMMGMDVHDMEDLGEAFVGYAGELERSSQFGTAYLRLARTLQPGFVLTNEPGIYFIPALIDKWKGEGINSDYICFDKVEAYRNFGGIRLEDDILVTPTGCRILGKRRIPIDVDDVEALTGIGM